MTANQLLGETDKCIFELQIKKGKVNYVLISLNFLKIDGGTVCLNQNIFICQSKL